MSAVPDAKSPRPVVEFQAPSSTDSSLPNTATVVHDLVEEEKKHFSIDLSLELERQLELEGSRPPTPSASADAQPHHESLDPHILTHIITGLKKTVDDITKERDDLLKLLETATTREASLQDTLQLMTEKATIYEEELTAARKKMKEDEEAIALLRNKVEESRRGLMRLQTESRRQSVAPPSALDLSRTGMSGFGNPPSSKRASFTPLTGRTNAHRRVSSISVDGQGLGVFNQTDLSPSPNGALTFSDINGSLGPPSARRSLFRHSPPLQDVPLPPANAPAPEVEALKKEIESLKRYLSDTRAELSEANEAREASEECTKVLRDFIAENQIGSSASGDSSSIKLPPPPTMTNGDEPDSERKTTGSTSGWGFKLWKADSTTKAPTVNMAISSSPPSNSSSAPNQQTPTPTASAPFSRFGSLFSSRASVSSTSSNPANVPIPRNNSYRDSMSGHSISVSDTSSVIEPLSPTNENHGNIRVTVVPEAGEGGVDRTLDAPVAKDQGEAITAQRSTTVIG